MSVLTSHLDSLRLSVFTCSSNNNHLAVRSLTHYYLLIQRMRQQEELLRSNYQQSCFGIIFSPPAQIDPVLGLENEKSVDSLLTNPLTQFLNTLLTHKYSSLSDNNHCLEKMLREYAALVHLEIAQDCRMCLKQDEQLSIEYDTILYHFCPPFGTLTLLYHDGKLIVCTQNKAARMTPRDASTLSKV